MEQLIYHFFPLTSVIFQITSRFYLPETFYLFEQRTFPGAFYSLPGNWTFLLLTEFCKEWNKWISEGAISGEYDGWIRTSRLSCNGFCLVIKEACSLAVSWWKVTHFLLTNSNHFWRIQSFTVPSLMLHKSLLHVFQFLPFLK